MNYDPFANRSQHLQKIMFNDRFIYQEEDDVFDIKDSIFFDVSYICEFFGYAEEGGSLFYEPIINLINLN